MPVPKNAPTRKRKEYARTLILKNKCLQFAIAISSKCILLFQLLNGVLFVFSGTGCVLTLCWWDYKVYYISLNWEKRRSCPLIFIPYLEDTSISHPDFQIINYIVQFIILKCNQLSFIFYISIKHLYWKRFMSFVRKLREIELHAWKMWMLSHISRLSHTFQSRLT